MDAHMQWFNETRCQAVVEALRHNRFQAYYAPYREQARELVLQLIPDGASVAFGGSMTMFETELVHSLRDPRYQLIDRHAAGLSPEELRAIARRSLDVDYFLTSANAVTEDGQLLFVDGINTRVAPVLYGPKNVILVVGANKICPDRADAEKRMRRVACPVNARRCNAATPCVLDGQCHDCNAPGRICNSTVILHRPPLPSAEHVIHVVMVAESLGY